MDDIGVEGSEPVSGCGQPSDPVRAWTGGTGVNWAGRMFTATGDRPATVDVRGSRSYWTNVYAWDPPPDEVSAWAVAALDAASGDVLAGQASIGTQRETGGGAADYSEPRVQGERTPPPDASFSLGPIEVPAGKRLVIVAAADSKSNDFALDISWTGCGQATEARGGFALGNVWRWSDLDATAKAFDPDIGSVAYQGSIDATVGSGLVLARAPETDSTIERTNASATTSEGAAQLSDGWTLLPHRGGSLAYTLDHAGRGSDAEHALLVHLPAPVTAPGFEAAAVRASPDRTYELGPAR